jgi:SOS response regulatory protein OraA/RecX
LPTTTPVAILVIPQDQGADRGDTLTYNALIRNNRGLDRTFGINISCLSGWSCNASRAQFDTPDKGTTNITVSIRSPATVPLGTYKFTATVRDILEPKVNSSASFNYTVGVCSRAAPTLSVNNSTASAEAGGNATFILAVANNDDCPGHFSYVATCPSGWNCTLSKTQAANVPFNGTDAVALNVTSSRNTTSGNYTLNFTATNTKDTTKSATASVEYRVVAGGPPPPPPTAFCGDGFCNNNETTATCPSDCVPPPPPPPPPPTIAECGNDFAESGEDCDGSDSLSCPGFCSDTCTCPFFVGDTICDEALGESAEISAQDCARGANFGLILVVVLIILGIAGGAGYYLYRRGGLSSLSFLHGVHTPKSGADLRPAVDTMMGQGYSSGEISSQLSGAGWSDTSVERAVNSAEKEQAELGVLAEKFEVDVPTTEVRKAEKYARACVDKGYTESQVRAALKDAGWPTSTVDEVIDKISSKEVEKHAEKLGVDKPSEDIEQLQKYVKKELKEGHTPQQIKKVLKDAGWTDSAIRQVLP